MCWMQSRGFGFEYKRFRKVGARSRGQSYWKLGLALAAAWILPTFGAKSIGAKMIPRVFIFFLARPGI